MAPNLYSTLNVSKNASQDEIKKAFKKMAVENHPDKHQGCKEKEEAFKSINQAYSILSDQEKRARYDQFGSIDESAGGGPDINDILKNMFGGGGMPGMPGMPGMGGMGGMGGMPGGFSFVFMDGNGGGGGMRAG